MGHLDGRQVLALHTVFGHVSGERVGELLHRADQPVGPLHQVQSADGRRRPRAGAADAHVGVTVHRPEDGNHVAHPRLDGANGQPNQRLRGGTAARAVHVEVGADAQVVLDGRGRCGIAAVVAEHAVDLVGRQSGVVHGVADRLRAQSASGAARSPAVLGLAHPDDAILVSWIACHMVPPVGNG